MNLRKVLTIGSLFAGIGGFDLAARWAGLETKWFSEIEPYASAVLKRHWPNVPNHGDITKIKGEAVERVDVLCGGFPCQDISLIGKGEGLSGTRSGLWFHYARLIEEIRPRYVVAENVAALRSRGLDEVLGCLDALGYDAEWHCIPASYLGAPHRRDRIWIVAHSQRPRLEGHAGDGGPSGRQAESGSITASCVRSGEDPAAWWRSEPNVGRVVDGVPARVDRLRCLGNAIVPQVAHFIFQAIAEREAQA